LIDQKINGSDALGKHPKTGEPIYVLTGRYGPYVQLGDATDEESKPKRVSLPAGMEPEAVGVEQALQLLELPRTLGVNPGTGKEIKAGLGRFGPYVVHDGDFRSIPKTDSLFEISLERALELLAKPKTGRGRAAPLRELGKPQGSDEVVAVYSGKYGPYIKQGKVNASLPEGVSPESITLEAALELLAAKGGKEAKAKSSAKKESKPKTSKAAKKAPIKSADKKNGSDEAGGKSAKERKVVVVKKGAKGASGGGKSLSKG
jgi:DNA topoisomerase-1